MTVVSIQIHRDALAAARDGWEDDPFVVSYNIEGVPGSGRCVVGVNVMIAAVLATCVSVMSLYSATGLVLELEMRDPEREKKLEEGDIISRIISSMATKILDKKEEPNKMVQMESRFKESENSTDYQPTFFQLPIK